MPASFLPKVFTLREVHTTHFSRFTIHYWVNSVDGAYFGTTFAHFLLLQNEDLIPAPPKKTYTPKVFGFRLHRDAITRRKPREKVQVNSASEGQGEVNQVIHVDSLEARGSK